LKADPSAQLKLLDVQALDARADQLRHRRATLPETAEIDKLTATRAERVDQLRDQQIAVDDLTAAQKKADADVEQVRTRKARDQQRMDQGLVGNAKDLERLQHELESLDRRIATLEDEELEVMEQLEEAQQMLAGLERQVAEADDRLAELTEERDRRVAEIDAELESLAGERAPLVADLPEDLLALYDRLREGKGGVGAAELRARQCGGCRLTLDNAELSQIRAAAPDLVVRCEECQRILVRTPESGL
jgi:predicted  nucleic acid-binding Zn-ribbon protein